MKLLLGTIASLFIFHSALALDLGQVLTPKILSTGKPALGFVYSNSTDPDGARYLVSFAAELPSSETATPYKVNYYQAKDDRFLLPWTMAKAVHLSVAQTCLQYPNTFRNLTTGLGCAE